MHGIYWLLVYLNYATPRIGRDFYIIDDHAQVVPIYHIFDAKKLYILLETPKSRSDELKIYANISVTQKIKTNDRQLTKWHQILDFEVYKPITKDIEKVIMDIPDKFRLPDHIKNRFLLKYHSALQRRDAEPSWWDINNLREKIKDRVFLPDSFIPIFAPLPALTNG
nr:hypothetical protein [Abalone asfa-like virus]